MRRTAFESAATCKVDGPVTRAARPDGTGMSPLEEWFVWPGRGEMRSAVVCEECVWVSLETWCGACHNMSLAYPVKRLRYHGGHAGERSEGTAPGNQSAVSCSVMCHVSNVLRN